jgi:uncharacterized membrane protein
MATLGVKETGIVVIVIAVTMFGLLLSMTNDIHATLETQCACGPGVCPMEGNLPPQSYLGFSMTLVLGGFGFYLFSKSRQIEKLDSQKKMKWNREINTLKKDEKEIVEKISSSDGVVFQSDLVDQLGISKVKVSRILDRLEHRGLLERRRRGMSNIVLLKNA